MASTERETRFRGVAHAVGDPLRRYVLRRVPADAVDDVLADVFLVLWRRLDDVPTDDPLPWAYGVARGCVANAQRAARRRLSLVERITRLDPPRPNVEDDDPDHADLREALDRLPTLDREVVTLWAWEGLAPREIATVTGLSANAVSIRLHRAKQRLALDLGRKSPGAAGQKPGEGRR
ncbi:sigma-70 family RNA polymerase sigma factor [Nocardioides humilatus]|uniref:Sigma-70 family RNA polymerase sigma factor n=1 Tax=Nocardioides humilatus TaxID=2607660 RepID=A0A5B1LHF1_9ACTN|nr:sigma-70 family RNA polymerase sigma factor [Nocardioides humilatus]KAA1419079.1 sigma-70 family RNA polymerase sigma factor [Nocardioides humilatus]